MGQLACRRFANRDQLFQGMAFVCCQRYPILCHGRIPFLGPFHTLRPYESESYVTRQSKIDEALGVERLPLAPEQDLASAPTFSRLEHSIDRKDLYRLTQ